MQWYSPDRERSRPLTIPPPIPLCECDKRNNSTVVSACQPCSAIQLSMCQFDSFKTQIATNVSHKLISVLYQHKFSRPVSHKKHLMACPVTWLINSTIHYNVVVESQIKSQWTCILELYNINLSGTLWGIHMPTWHHRDREVWKLY